MAKGGDLPQDQSLGTGLGRGYPPQNENPPLSNRHSMLIAACSTLQYSEAAVKPAAAFH